MRQKRGSLHDRLAARREATFRLGGMLKLEPAIRASGEVILTYLIPCCGGRRYDFPDVKRECLICGKDLSTTPVQVEGQYDLRHSRVTRYVS